MRRHFVQERGKKRRHSSATATVFNLPAGRRSYWTKERADSGYLFRYNPLIALGKPMLH